MVLSSALLNNRTWNRHGLKIVWGLAFMFLLAVIALLSFKEYLYHTSKAAEYSPQALAPISNNKPSSYRATDITSANLFGDATPKVKKVETIRPTTLNIKLIGVLWATDPKFGRVVIQTGNKKSKLYSLGDDIEGAGASVKEIHSNEILISRNGAIEKLPLQTKKGSKDILSFSENSASLSYASSTPQTRNQPPSEIRRSTRKPVSANGQNRKIRRPNFSGLDRALQKTGEI